MDDLYKRIETLCKLEDISVTEMCKGCGISRAPLSDFKMGRTKTLSTKTLSKIAEYFDVSVDYLLAGTPQKPVKINVQFSDNDAASKLEDGSEQRKSKRKINVEFGGTKKNAPTESEDVEELIRDEPIAAYQNLKEHLTDADKADIAHLIRIRAELNQNKG